MSGDVPLLLVVDATVERLLTSAIDRRRVAGSVPYAISVARSWEEAQALAAVEPPAVIVADTSLSASDPVAAVESLARALPTVPVIALIEHDDPALGGTLVDAGAQDFLAIGDIGEAVVRRTLRHARERHRLIGSLERLAITDHLTGLYNRRGLELVSERLLAEARRSHMQVSLLYADLDGLKPVNDTEGHDAGDALIKAAAALLRAQLRDSDVIARVGGDEFACVLLDADREGVSRRLRSALATTRERRLSMSFAIATAGGGTADLFQLMEQADRAMYQQKRARQAGRGSVGR